MRERKQSPEIGSESVVGESAAVVHIVCKTEEPSQTEMAREMAKNRDNVATLRLNNTQTCA